MSRSTVQRLTGREKSFVLRHCSVKDAYRDNRAMNLSREEKCEILKQLYLECLVEDPIDGTTFDLAILDSLDILAKQFDEGAAK